MDHPARLLLRENGLDDDGDLIFRRVQSADGRTKAYVNDQAVSVQMMRQLGQHLVEIHGQHDDRALVDTNAHRAPSRCLAGLSDEVTSVQGLYRTWKDAERGLKVHRAKVEAAAREAIICARPSKSWKRFLLAMARRRNWRNAGGDAESERIAVILPRPAIPERQCLACADLASMMRRLNAEP